MQRLNLRSHSPLVKIVQMLYYNFRILRSYIVFVAIWSLFAYVKDSLTEVV